jgi:Lar family restriction alleviation protein
LNTPTLAEVEGLKPCPFCGSDAALSRIISPEGERRGEQPSWDLDCTGCGLWRRFDTEVDAIEAWNTRAALSQPDRSEKL